MKILLISAILILTHCAPNTESGSIEVPGKGFAVVELFTSEGCSSCPPADKAIGDLVSKKMNNVFVLVYHVDYWDRLGWKDAFSSRDFSDRQRKYAAMLKSNSVYTPQIIFNGTTGFVGSDVARLTKEVKNSLQNNVSQFFDASAIREGDEVNFSYKLNSPQNLMMNVAIVQAQADRKIGGGENDGLTLHHANIVRNFKSFNADSSGNISLPIPKDLAGKSYSIIAFTQSKKTGRILSAKQIFL